MTKQLCIIPARMASSRFPGKPMAPLLGLPLILHVWHRCLLAEVFTDVVVATCNKEIFDCVEAAGGRAIITSDSHERCTDRVAEAIVGIDPGGDDETSVVMVQGDEVLVDPAALKEIPALLTKKNAMAINLLSPIDDPCDCEDVNVVKAVTALDGRIIYLSRAAIPSRARKADAAMMQQTGVIAFRRIFLERFAALPPTPLEVCESIDMMRLIEHGLPLYSVVGERPTVGVDTETDRVRAEAALADDPWTAAYM